MADELNYTCIVCEDEFSRGMQFHAVPCRGTASWQMSKTTSYLMCARCFADEEHESKMPATKPVKPIETTLCQECGREFSEETSSIVAVAVVTSSFAGDARRKGRVPSTLESYRKNGGSATTKTAADLSARTIACPVSARQRAATI
eukprot:CAMPEP_0178508996 /NCGR_PEP_ID=MMETSP0696-20121128/21051_1 /TAXON_ID=265572 /ORGANISM="Extubocellulus spinifer, Strain CCMP396" /LENGTH=145 /DNA_ID=CAMNT_0020138589 /DNA_START=58 /DNA_END=496 /DNA_ORIENTATION=+